jgi:hypothetical protein
VPRRRLHEASPAEPADRRRVAKLLRWVPTRLLLRGRVQAIVTHYWSDDELEQIANAGFEELNVDVAPAIVKKLISEAFGSPQLFA